MRLTLSRSLCSFKGDFFSFLSVFSAQHDFGICVSSISEIMFLVFQRTKGNPLYVFILRRINSNSLRVFTLWRINGNCLISVVWKFTTCWLFGCFFLNTNHGRRSASPLMHTWLIGSGVLPCPCHLVLNREGWRKTTHPLPLLCLLL